MREGQTLFTYLHLAATRDCTEALLKQGSPRSPTRPCRLPTGALPLLVPDVARSPAAGAAGRRLPT